MPYIHSVLMLLIPAACLVAGVIFGWLARGPWTIDKNCSNCHYWKKKWKNLNINMSTGDCGWYMAETLSKASCLHWRIE